MPIIRNEFYAEGKYEPKEYEDNGDTLHWGEDIPRDKSERMRNGEVFTLLGHDGRPYSKVLKDSYNAIRETRIADEPTAQADKAREGLE